MVHFSFFRFKVVTCDWCKGSGQIQEIVEHRGAWVYKPRRCNQCHGFGKVDR